MSAIYNVLLPDPELGHRGDDGVAAEGVRAGRWHVRQGRAPQCPERGRPLMVAVAGGILLKRR